MASQKTIAALVAACALSTLVHCANKASKSSSNDPTCTGTQALQSVALRGSSMDPKAVALTFDDGPGARTSQLSKFLKAQGIQAAFFVNGKQMGPGAPEVLNQLVSDGHLVANHTESHRSLTGHATGEPPLSAGDVVAEVAQTDAKIEPFVPSKRFLFRPPFGDFDGTTLAALEASPMNKYVGPVLWDVGDRMDEATGRVADWDCWQDGVDGKRIPMTVCGDMYVTEIKRASRGIVLLHDPYFNEQDPEQLGTVDMVMYMVPKLKEEGFTFIRVDKIAEIAALLPPLPPEEEVLPDGGLAGEGGAAGSGGGGPCP